MRFISLKYVAVAFFVVSCMQSVLTRSANAPAQAKSLVLQSKASGNRKSATKTAKTPDKTWSLTQTSDHYGLVHTELNKEAAALKTSEFSLYIGPPDYSLVMISDETKHYFRRSMSNLDAFGRNQLLEKQQGGQVRVGKTAKIAGITATQYTWKPKNSTSTLEWWTTKDFGTSDKLNTACLTYSGLAGMPCHGFPLRYGHFNAYGGKYIYLNTLSVKPDATPVNFKIPANYTQVATPMDLVTPDDVQMRP